MFSRFIRIICIVSFLLFTGYIDSFAAINFSITPIKYDLELNPGESITLPATIKNNSSDPVTLPTATSDFTSSGVGGVPEFVRKSELVHPDQQLSSWISLSATGITLAPGEEGSVDFTINIPANATPGGHYAAVFFKRANSESSSGDVISIDVDYGILVLVNVSGDVVVGGSVGTPIISGGGIFSTNYGSSTGNTDNNTSPEKEEKQEVDNCPLGDLTVSKYDNKCIDIPFINSEDNEPLLFENNEPYLFEDDFLVNFTIPIENTGNTHLKPTGKIILTDEDGNVIKAIGEENIATNQGVIIGKNIVDYIPINDEQGYILPLTKRDFTSVWRGFPYKGYDDAGNPIINYWTPGEYYTQKNKDNAGFLMFWERVSKVKQHKTITADIEVTYYDTKGKAIVFNTAQEFPVEYIEEEVTLNPYVILALAILLAIALMTWFAFRWWFLIAKTKHCWKCKENIKSHWETCPYCKSIQNKKKQKAFEKQKEAKKTKKK